MSRSRPGVALRQVAWAACALSTLVLALAPGALRAQDELLPEARQVLFGYRAVLRVLPAEGREALVARLREWAHLSPAEREAVVDVCERLRYVPPSAVGEALRNVPAEDRWKTLAALALTGRVFAGEPARALIVLAGVGAPSEVVIGEEGPRLLPRVWKNLPPKGLLFTSVEVPKRSRAPAKWGAALLTGRFEAVTTEGRPRFPTLFEALRKARGQPRRAAWLVASGDLLTRADYSVHPDFGKDFAALKVDGSLFRFVARQRKAYIEAAVRRGVKRPTAEARARGLSADALGLAEIYPEADLRRFIYARMEHEPGAGVANTFTFLMVLKALERYRPHLMLVCFGEPAAEHSRPPERPRREEARSEADYRQRLRTWQGRLEAWRKALPDRRREALADLDLYVDYLYREFARNPYYGRKGMFVLVLGDPGEGMTQVLFVSARTPAGRQLGLRRPFHGIAPTVARFLGVPLEGAVVPPLKEVFEADPHRPGGAGAAGPPGDPSDTRKAG